MNKEQLNFAAESAPNNTEQKCTCVLAIDTSRSMSFMPKGGKKTPIDALNEALVSFQNSILEDSLTANRLELCIVTFGGNGVNTVLEPSLLCDIEMMPYLTSSGGTPLIQGVRHSIKMVEEAKLRYKNTGLTYYRPWIIAITDGEPDPAQGLHQLGEEIAAGMEDEHFIFFALGVQGADMEKLRMISHPMMPAQYLDGIRFNKFFDWVGATMKAISHSQTGDNIQLPQRGNIFTDGYAS